MTEKQRWLIRDLDAWRGRQMDKIGRYGPSPEPKMPPAVRAAQRAERKAHAVLKRWEQEKKRPWNQQRDRIDNQFNAVKRVILFESTATALKAIKGLK